LGPVVAETFWEEMGAALAAAAGRVGLPRWPLQGGKLGDPGSRSGWAKNWQQPV
jgi:hypothetical protein